MNDRAEVCPLSRRTIFQSVSCPLQTGFRFFRIPLPALPIAPLTVGLPSGRRYGLTLFHLTLGMVRTCPMYRRRSVHDGPSPKGDHSLPHTVLVQACQHVWLVVCDDTYRTFTCVGRTHSSLAPCHLRASSFRLASRLGVPDIRRLLLSPELHTKPLPVQHVRVGSG